MDLKTATLVAAIGAGIATLFQFFSFASVDLGLTYKALQFIYLIPVGCYLWFFLMLYRKQSEGKDE